MANGKRDLAREARWRGFRNKNVQRAKILWWDKDGLAIYYKRLEKGTFRFPSSDAKSVAISSAELMRLLSGLELSPSR